VHTAYIGADQRQIDELDTRLHVESVTMCCFVTDLTSEEQQLLSDIRQRKLQLLEEIQVRSIL